MAVIALPCTHPTREVRRVTQTDKIAFWMRMVADQVFRDAVIEDPLRAVADTPEVDVSADQVRQLDEMEFEERREFITQVVRDAYFKGAVARWGPLNQDGAFGASGDVPESDEGPEE